MENSSNTGRWQENSSVQRIKDFSELEKFYSGIEEMDTFIQNELEQSVKNHYCIAYSLKYKDELVAIFAISFDSLKLDAEDKNELIAGMSNAGTPNIDIEYSETFYSKLRYPALDISYLAVKKEWQHKKIGKLIIDIITDIVKSQAIAGCQFLTVEAYKSKTYSAVGFYQKCGFNPTEYPKPYKQTLRMFKTIYME